MLGDTPDGAFADVYEFGTVQFDDRVLIVDGAVLHAGATDLGSTATLYVSAAADATDRWGRTYSADLGVLSIESAGPPGGRWSGKVVAGDNSINVSATRGDVSLHTMAEFEPGRTGLGGIYTDGFPLHYQPSAHPALYFEGLGTGPRPFQTGPLWTLDLGHVALGAKLPGILLGAENYGSGGVLTGTFTGLTTNDGAWTAQSVGDPAEPFSLFRGARSPEYTFALDTSKAGLHTATVTLRSFDDDWTVGHARMPDQVFTIRATVDAPPPMRVTDEQIKGYVEMADRMMPAVIRAYGGEEGFEQRFGAGSADHWM